MTVLYVANTTKQEQNLFYRLPKEKGPNGRIIWKDYPLEPLLEQIPAGQQVQLGGGKDFSEFEAESLIAYHVEGYGHVRGGQYKRGFVGLVWDTKPIKVEKIEEGIAQNQVAQQDRANKILDNTAAATLKREQEQAQLTGAPPPDRATIEVIPEPSKTGETAQGRGAEALAEGVAPRKARG